MSTGGPSDRQQAIPAVAGGGGRSGEPPNLTLFSNSPSYDLATVVHLVGVRPMILWGWEQNLGFPTPVRINEEAGTVVRRYSERDLVASLWLRDQILNGTSPPEAAERLRAAMCLGSGDDAPWTASDSGWRPGGRVTTGPLPDSFTPQRSPNLTRPLTDNSHLPAGGLGAAEPLNPRSVSYGPTVGGVPSGVSDAAQSHSTVWVGPVSGQPGGRRSLGESGTSRMSGPLASGVMPAPRSGQLASGAEYGLVTSGPLPSPPLMPGMYGASHTGESTMRAMSWSVTPGSGVSTSTSTRGREMQALVPLLLRALANFDTLGANHVLEEALSTRSVETVCKTLLQPALARVSDLWASHRVTAPEQRFASNYIRGILFALFHQTPERLEAPVVVVSCGPREMSDIHALVLAVFLRRAGLRVNYLGQDLPGAEAVDLVDEVRKRRPAMLALSVASPQRLRALARVGKAIGQLDAPHPTFAFTGPIFVRNPELLRKVDNYGYYLGDDPDTATSRVMQLVSRDFSMRR